MEPETQTDHDCMRSLLEANNALLVENNALLKKIDRRDIRAMWFKFIWIALLIGLPLLFMSYFINTYMGMLGLGSNSADSPSILESLSEAQRTLDELRGQ